VGSLLPIVFKKKLREKFEWLKTAFARITCAFVVDSDGDKRNIPINWSVSTQINLPFLGRFIKLGSIPLFPAVFFFKTDFSSRIPVKKSRTNLELFCSVLFVVYPVFWQIFTCSCRVTEVHVGFFLGISW
jgi:hypothetical protein